MKTKQIVAGVAFAVASVLSTGAYASKLETVNMTFASGGVFSGVVTFADDYSSYSAVNGTLTGGSNNYNSAITWVWDTSNWSSGAGNYSNWLMDGTDHGNYRNWLQLAYNYTNAPILSFTSGVSYGQFDNFVNYRDQMISGSIGDVSAVPLPAAAPLMLSALGAFGLAARRRKAKVEAV